MIYVFHLPIQGSILWFSKLSYSWYNSRYEVVSSSPPIPRYCSNQYTNIKVKKFFLLQGWKQEKKCTWKVYLIILRKVAEHREGQRGDTQGVTDIALIAVVVNLSILDPLCALGGDNHWNRFQHVHHRPPDESLDMSTFLQWLAFTIQCFHYTGFHYTV